MPARPSSTALTSSLAIVAFALAAGLMGALPHVLFSFELGRVAYFKYAYDEEFYQQCAADGLVFGNRVLGFLVLRSFDFLAGGSAELAEILIDLVIPIGGVAAAGVLASELAKRPSTRVALAVGLVFSQELLSLACAVVWGDAGPGLLNGLRAVLPAGERLVPESDTTYFGIYRTPEPQVSLGFLFLGMAAFTRLVGSDGAPDRRSWVLSLASVGLLPTIYFFPSFTLLALALLTAAILVWRRQWSRLLPIAAALAMTVGVYVVVAAVRSPHGMPSSGILFASRLPVVTPSALLAFGLAIFVLLRRGEWTGTRMLSLACSLVILVLTNQQIVTGVMMSVKEWERYSCYPLLVLAAALAAKDRGAGKEPAAAEALRAAAWVVAAVVLMLRGQILGYRAWHEINLEAWAVNHALARPEAEPYGAARVLVEPADDVPLVRLREPRGRRFVLDFDRVFLEPVADLPPGGAAPAGRALHLPALFEYFVRRGIAPDGVRQLLTDEIRGGKGFYSGFLFSHKDFWPPFSDRRALRPPDLLAHVDGVVAAYETYLGSAPEVWNDAVLVVTWQPPEKRRPNPFFTSTLLVEARAPGREDRPVYVYRQTRS